MQGTLLIHEHCAFKLQALMLVGLLSALMTHEAAIGDTIVAMPPL